MEAERGRLQVRFPDDAVLPKAKCAKVHLTGICYRGCLGLILTPFPPPSFLIFTVPSCCYSPF